jgi:hypothetical protein
LSEDAVYSGKPGGYCLLISLVQLSPVHFKKLEGWRYVEAPCRKGKIRTARKNYLQQQASANKSEYNM